MAEISKQALKVDNNQSFPNNNNGAITPSILRAFNVNMIDSMVDEIGYNLDSGSWNQQIDALEQFTASASGLTTGSLLVTASAVNNVITFTKGNNSTFNVTVATGSIPDISNLNQATASLQTFTASANIKFTNIESTTASLNTSVTNINSFTASADISITNLNTNSASQQVSIDNLNSKTGSYATTGSNTFTGPNIFTSISASSFVSASEFIGNGSKITGITASISMPILDEGIPQGNAFSLNFTGSGISAIVVGGTAVISVNTPDSGTINNLTASFNAYTSSTNLDLAAIHQATASLEQFTASFSTASLVSTSSFNQYTQSNDQRVTSLEANSASVNTSVTNLNLATSSLFTSASLAIVTASVSGVNLTFTKGDGTQFTLQTATGSVVSASYAETSSYSQFATDIYLNVKNTTGGQLNKGTVVRIIGATGDNALVATASWEDDNNSANTLGFLYENIPNDNFGKVITNGNLVGINTDGYTAGQILYLSSSGQYTNVKPDAPYHEVRLGQVLRPQLNNGSIYIQIQNGYELEELHDVDINTGSLANKDILAYDSVSGQWENWSISGLGLAITGSNTFVADQTVSASIKVTGNIEMNKDLNAGIFFPMDSGRSVRIQKQVGINRLSWVAEDNAKLMYLDLDTDEFFVSGGFQAGLQDGYAWVGQSNGYSSAVPTSSFASSVNTASFATTGSNNFKGRESISDVEGTGTGEVYLLGRSGSLILGNSTTATYAGLSHYSSSTVQGGVNLILKSNNTATPLTISGSDNLISNPSTATAGFRRFIGSGGGNITIGTSGTNIPQISGSMAFPITMNNNYIAGVLQARGPVSSSTWTISNSILPGNIVIGSTAILNAEKLVSGLNMSANIVAGTLSIIGNQSFISTSANIVNNNINGTVTLQLSSSAITMQNNSINDSAFSFVNQFSSGAVGIGQPQMNVNTVGGASNTFILTGSQLGAGFAPGFNQNLLLGNANALFVNASTARVNGANIYHNAFANALLGQRLIASGSSNLNDAGSFGSVFVGRNNANDGIRNKTSDIVFAVGTGISSSADTRKTGFLIDSGSNTFVEGTLNVSGATTLNGNLIITGSARGNVVALSIASNTASMDLNTANYFTLTLADTATTHITATNIQPGTSATLVITTGTNSSASLAPTLLEPSGSDYIASNGSAKKDVLSFVAVDSTNMFVVSTKNMI